MTGPLSRRGFLALPLALTPLASRASVDDPAAARVDWRDVTLIDGSVLRAETLRGHAVVVEFWASWCPFCARQNPSVQKLWDAQRDRGLRILTYSIDRDAAAARAYVAKRRYTFPVAMASGDSARWFGVRKGLPMLYVVGANGRVVFEEAGEMFAEDVAALSRFAASAAGT